MIPFCFAGAGKGGMKRKFMRKAPPPQVTVSPHPPPAGQEVSAGNWSRPLVTVILFFLKDPLLAQDNQANKEALFMRMLKSWQIQPKKIRSFRRCVIWQ